MPPFNKLMKKCKKCGMKADGYKCELCGVESKNHDPNHVCGGAHCVLKCSGCGQAETKCTC